MRAPKELPVRPTTDFAKEALFNILANDYDFENLEIIDLYAGTGNISYEFMSRGAIGVTAVDSHSKCLAYISKTSKELGFDIKTVKSDSLAYLRKTPQKADIIFADPPYDSEEQLLLEIINLTFERQLLKPDGMLIIEHDQRKTFEKHRHFKTRKKYGSSLFSFFRQELER